MSFKEAKEKAIKEAKKKAIKEFLDAWRKLSLYGITICDARNGEPVDSDDISFDWN